MRIWGWGANKNGQLGLHHKSEQESTPTEIHFNEPSSEFKVSPVAIIGGSSDTVALLRPLLPFPCSDNNDQEFVKTPSPITNSNGLQISRVTSNFQFFTSSAIDTFCLAAGWEFMVCCDDDGNVLAFGDNSFGQLGFSSDQTSCTQPVDILDKDKKWIKYSVRSLNDPTSTIKINKIAAGLRHVVAISDQNKNLYVWGDNSKSQLGIPHSTKIVHTPTKVEFEGSEDNPKSLLRFKAITCGKDFSLAVTEEGILHGCGSNKFGSLGHASPDFKAFDQWTKIVNFEERGYGSIKEVKSGWSHILVLLGDGRVLSWGRNDFGQLGRSTDNPKYDHKPGFIKFHEKILSIACGSEHNLALSESNKVYAWGWNEHDNCGFGSSPEKLDFIPFPKVVPFPLDVKINVIGCGAGSSFAASIS